MTTTPTTPPTSGAAIQRYKIGYHADEWGQRSSTPSGIPDASGSWVRYADHVTALAAGQATAAQAVVQDDLITIRKPTTSAEMLWLLKLAHLVISDVDKTLEETFAPAQPAAQQGAAYAALPTSNYAGRVYEEGFLIGTCPLYTADQMRAFADATYALRASHGQAPATQPAPPQEAQEPDFWTVCAQYEGGDETGWVPLPGYSNETEHGVKHLVLKDARNEGYKGTAAGRLLELGWEIRPVFLTPQPAQAQAVAVPLTRERVKAICVESGYETATQQERADFINGIRHAERHHGIKGGQHDTE